MRFGSLFSGIGGIDLGLQRAGMRCKFQVEIDPFCQRVLEKHWPAVRRFEDVTQVSPATLPKVDVLAAGFPCQDLSKANNHGARSISGKRSGLFYEVSRIARGMGRTEGQPMTTTTTRIQLTDGSGRWFDGIAATKFEETTQFDGNNHVSRATGDKFKHEALFRTADGNWILNHWSQWQGTLQTYLEISDAEAATWLSVNEHEPHEACAEEFAALEIA